MTITAHGATYASVAEANARIAELNEVNMAIGISDGRVTEIQTIIGALQEAGVELTPRQAAHMAKVKAEAIKLGPLTMQYIMESERRIRQITADKSRDDGKWRYLKVQTPEGRTTAREYRTELGFLKAYVREARRGSDILIAE